MTDTSFPTLPHPIIEPHIGIPTEKAIRRIEQDLFANAMEIESRRGGGAQGHLALCLSPADYLAIPGTIAFVPPPDPGDEAVHNPGASDAVRRSNERRHDKQVAEYKLYNKARTTLMQQLIAAIEPQYTNSLKHPRWGFAGVTPVQILTHLRVNYAEVTDDDKADNRDILKQPWDPDSPLASLWDRVTSCQQYAKDNDDEIPISHVIHSTLAVFKESGVMNHDVTRWKERVAEQPAAMCTYEHFQAHFNRANKERMRNLTAEGAGFHGANAANATKATKASTNSGNNKTETTKPAPFSGGTNVYYCWSHGITFSDAHTSHNCSNQKEGHKSDATAKSTKGGFPINTSGAIRNNSARALAATAAKKDTDKKPAAKKSKRKSDDDVAEALANAIIATDDEE